MIYCTYSLCIPSADYIFHPNVQRWIYKLVYVVGNVLVVLLSVSSIVHVVHISQVHLSNQQFSIKSVIQQFRNRITSRITKGVFLCLQPFKQLD